ncbi:uncharacterized protein B0H18DRAFT_1027502 [Fomitopsis serialis]|uniref:uncharacterized protein n=1 Tax=Fomitopsis serialis TaxID=139415 RepID=UPI00200798EC|nr:uncharacterized protein B0H18DRAFT_1027502 [Neoantrodia serialis]KAH9919535.1 hypothetical protein B0H18DRAFT_1027502 [Neoantrodia serialis]
MHRALCISEIIRDVFVYASQQCILDDTTRRVCAWHACGTNYPITQRGHPTPRHACLLAVALSCKTFSGVALDLLWRVLDSPEPLRSLMKYHSISVRIQPEYAFGPLNHHCRMQRKALPRHARATVFTPTASRDCCPIPTYRPASELTHIPNSSSPSPNSAPSGSTSRLRPNTSVPSDSSRTPSPMYASLSSAAGGTGP